MPDNRAYSNGPRTNNRRVPRDERNYQNRRDSRSNQDVNNRTAEPARSRNTGVPIYERNRSTAISTRSRSTINNRADRNSRQSDRSNRPREHAVAISPQEIRNKRMLGDKLYPAEDILVGSVDYTILIVVIILTIIGIVMVYSASYTLAGSRSVFEFNPFFFLTRNLRFAAMGIVALFIMTKIHYEIYRKVAVPVYVITAGMLVAVMVIGVSTRGAVRWLPMPVIGQFMPSEVAKLALVLMMAYWIDKERSALDSWMGLFAFSAIVGVMTLLVLYGGFSSALIVGAIGFGMIFIASKHFLRFVAIGGILAALVGGYLLWDSIWGGGFRGGRWTVWLDPWSDSLNLGFQTIQSLYALASGSWFGLGIGQSRQASVLPDPHNDIIFAIIVEELGLFGGFLILGLYIILIWRGIMVALNAPDVFSQTVAFGIVFSLAFQTLINIAVVTNTIPNTGVTLPFISYGGTSLLMSMAMAGILLSISRYTKVKDSVIKELI